MYGGWFDWLVTIVGVLLVGVAVKMMDDALDVEYDQCIGKKTVSARLGRAGTPYVMLLLGFGIFILHGIGLALFLASYAIGMGHDLREKMPTGLPGWGEAIAVFALGIVFTQVLLMVWALLIILVIQILDDFVDQQRDQLSGQRNIIQRFGMVESTLVLTIAFLLAVVLDPQATVAVLIAVPLIHVTMDLLGGV